MYNTFQRIAWNGAVAWVIFSCAKGYGGIINEFLSWPAFAPLSRLTFTTYLIHMNVISMFASSVLSSFPSDYAMWAAVWYYLAIQFVSCVISFVISLVFEIPFTKVEKILVEQLILKPLLGKSQPKSKNDVLKDDMQEKKNPKDIQPEELVEKPHKSGNFNEAFDNKSESTIERETPLQDDPEKISLGESNGNESSRGSSQNSSSGTSAPPSYDQLIAETETIK